MSKVKLQQLLTQRLGLSHPIFRLEKIGSKLAAIISSSFAGMSDLQRQRKIWDAIDAELGSRSVIEVGTLLAYTPAEWDIDLPAKAS